MDAITPFKEDDNYKYFCTDMENFPRVEETAKISERGNTLFETPKDVEVYTADPMNGEQGWHPVTGFSIHPNLDIYGTRLHTGEIIFSSRTDSIMVYDRGTFRAVDLNDAEGKMVPVVVQTPPNTVGKETHTLAEGRGGRGNHKMEFNMPLNYDTGLFLGLIIGDGWVDCADTLFLASSSDKLPNRDTFKRLTRSDSLPYKANGNETSTIDRVSKNIAGNMTSRGKISISLAWFNRWLKSQIGSGAFEKRIPSFCFYGPREHLLGLLDGLLCTDGGVSTNRNKKAANLLVKYHTSGMQLVLDVQRLCQLLNTKTTVVQYTSSVSGNSAFSIALSNLGLKRLYTNDDFTLSHPDKDNIFKTFIPRIVDVVPHDLDLVPTPTHLLAEVDAAIKGYKRNGNEIRELTVKGWAKRKEAMSKYYYIFDKLPVAQSVDWQMYFKLIGDSTIQWRRIHSIQKVKGKHTAFDLTVPATGTFTLVTGNTQVVVKQSDGDAMSIHVPVSQEAVQDVVEKMLPSKNLLGAASFSPMYAPSNEASLGLFQLSTENKKNEAKEYATEADVLKAYASGELMPGDNVKITQQKQK